MWVARYKIDARPRAIVVRTLLGTVLAVAYVGQSAGQSGTLQPPTAGTAPPAKVITAPTAAPRQPVHPAQGNVPRASQPTPPASPRPPVAPPAKPKEQTNTRSALPLPPPPPPPPPEEQAGPAHSTGGTAPGSADGAKPTPEGPQLPRFASLKSDQVNLRAGPGTRYPIQWVYNRRELPVEIEREFEVWRAIRDPDGVRGWVHQATLTGRRTFVVKGADATIRSDRKDTASAVAIARVNVMGRLRACEGGSAWCEVRVGNVRGYLRRDQIWGLLPNEVVKP